MVKSTLLNNRIKGKKKLAQIPIMRSRYKKMKLRYKTLDQALCKAMRLKYTYRAM